MNEVLQSNPFIEHDDDDDAEDDNIVQKTGRYEWNPAILASLLLP